MMNRYKNSVILAPMVRVGLLPSRLTALEYGADLVYTDEMIDKKIIGSVRTVNDKLGTVDFMREGRVMFRAAHVEKDRLVFQMGTADPQLALQCALMVAEDVSVIDVNCGCPKPFSTHAGMGVALLKTPDLLIEILETLVKHCGKPVSCKIRIYKDMDETIKLVKRLEATGICALAVHGRTATEGRQDRAHWDVFQQIAEAVSIPVIANGDMFTRRDIDSVMKTGVAGVMLARAAQHNMSIFRKEGPLPPNEAARKYLEFAIKYDNPYQNVKYCVMSSNIKITPEQSQLLHRCKSTAELCRILGWDDLAEAAREAAKQRIAESQSEIYDDMFPYVPNRDYIPTPAESEESVEIDSGSEQATGLKTVF